MSRNIDIKIAGREKLLKAVEKGGIKIITEIDANFDAAAQQFVRDAQRKAPKDTGMLSKQVTYKREKILSYSISSGSKYAGYLEFGTKKRFKPIPGFEDVAASIRGKTGQTAEQAIDNIKAWVRRKGIRFESAGKFKSGKNAGKNKMLSVETTAYIIYHYIMLNGIKPQPYFFQNVEPMRKNVERSIEAIEKAFD